MRIVFFGTPRFARIILESLFNRPCEIVAVVAKPDKPAGRSSKPVFSPVKSFALQHNIPLYQPAKASDPEFAAILKEMHADFFVVAAYGEILKNNILQLPKIACINIHGSLLPKYRGAAPVPRALIEGEVESGVTIMKMAPQLDTGDILAIAKTPLSSEINAGELLDLLADLSKDILWESLIGLEKGTLQPIPQQEGLATYAKKLLPQEGEIDWTQSARVIHNQVRGFTPNPGAWCWVEINREKKRLLIKRTALCQKEGPPGAIISAAKGELIVGCKEGSLSLLEIQLEGKKRLTAAEFLRGIPAEKIRFL